MSGENVAYRRCITRGSSAYDLLHSTRYVLHHEYSTQVYAYMKYEATPLRNYPFPKYTTSGLKIFFFVWSYLKI